MLRYIPSRSTLIRDFIKKECQLVWKLSDHMIFILPFVYMVYHTN